MQPTLNKALSCLCKNGQLTAEEETKFQNIFFAQNTPTPYLMILTDIQDTVFCYIYIFPYDIHDKNTENRNKNAYSYLNQPLSIAFTPHTYYFKRFLLSL